MTRKTYIGRLFIQNWAAVSSLLPTTTCWALYRVNCVRGVYVGISKNVLHRAYQHAVGYSEWTKTHGSISMTVLALFGSEEAAQIAEWRYYWKRIASATCPVGGFSQLAQQWQMGHA